MIAFMVKPDKDIPLKLDVLEELDILTNKFTYDCAAWLRDKHP